MVSPGVQAQGPVARSHSQPSSGFTLQSTKPSSHRPRPQVPPAQTEDAWARSGQAISHEPQCWTSFIVSAQAPEQHTSAPSQGCATEQPWAHVPPAQTIPPGHCVSSTHATHTWLTGSHTSGLAQSVSASQPSSQVFVAALQKVPAPQLSPPGKQPTHSPVSGLQTGVPARAAQSSAHSPEPPLEPLPLSEPGVQAEASSPPPSALSAPPRKTTNQAGRRDSDMEDLRADNTAAYRGAYDPRASWRKGQPR
jgi:hypothetical protein